MDNIEKALRIAEKTTDNTLFTNDCVYTDILLPMKSIIKINKLGFSVTHDSVMITTSNKSWKFKK